MGQNRVSPDWPREYLGDGLYGAYDGYNVWLLANDSKHPTDVVCLEPAVLRALERYVVKFRALSRPPSRA